ncbi:hypothetical protein ABIA40_004019 [Bradyrhizobium sp. USDA 223]
MPCDAALQMGPSNWNTPRMSGSICFPGNPRFLRCTPRVSGPRLLARVEDPAISGTRVRNRVCSEDRRKLVQDGAAGFCQYLAGGARLHLIASALSQPLKNLPDMATNVSMASASLALVLGSVMKIKSVSYLSRASVPAPYRPGRHSVVDCKLSLSASALACSLSLLGRPNGHCLTNDFAAAYGAGGNLNKVPIVQQLPARMPNPSRMVWSKTIARSRATGPICCPPEWESGLGRCLGNLRLDAGGASLGE